MKKKALFLDIDNTLFSHRTFTIPKRTEIMYFSAPEEAGRSR